MTFFTPLGQRNIVKPLPHPDIRHTFQEHNHKKGMTCQPAWILILLSSMILGTVEKFSHLYSLGSKSLSHALERLRHLHLKEP